MNPRSPLSLARDRRDGISRCEPFVSPEKRRFALTPSVWSRRSLYIQHPGEERSAAGFTRNRCDLGTDRREAPRCAPFLRVERSDSRLLAARDAVAPGAPIDGGEQRVAAGHGVFADRVNATR